MYRFFFIFPGFFNNGGVFGILRENIASKNSSQTVESVIVPNLLLLFTCFRKIIFIFLTKWNCATRWTCFCFDDSNSGDKKVTKIRRFSAKCKKLNCLDLQVTQDYSGKRYSDEIEWKYLSFEVGLVTQQDLDWKIFANQNH